MITSKNKQHINVHFNFDSIQLLTLSQKEATLIEVQKRCKRISFSASQKVHLLVVVILRPCKTIFVTTALKLSLTWNNLNFVSGVAL